MTAWLGIVGAFALGEAVFILLLLMRTETLVDRVENFRAVLARRRWACEADKKVVVELLRRDGEDLAA